MVSNENSTGKPLADYNWLQIHHNAKLKERENFAKRLSKFNPKKIVDLGCASGLWLNLLDTYIKNECEFIGIDSDEEVLEIAKTKSKKWNRKSAFIKLDIENEAENIPASDLTLAFNIFPYINNLDKFVNTLSNKNSNGILAVRQYDGASIRFGPLETSFRQKIEAELRLATESNKNFKHYDMDRTFKVLNNSKFKNKDFNFELFERNTPFEEDFISYYKETLIWSSQFLSDNSKETLLNWMNSQDKNSELYFYEVDLVAILS